MCLVFSKQVSPKREPAYTSKCVVFSPKFAFSWKLVFNMIKGTAPPYLRIVEACAEKHLQSASCDAPRKERLQAAAGRTRCHTAPPRHTGVPRAAPPQANPARHHRTTHASVPRTAPPHHRTTQAYPAPHHRSSQAYPRTALEFSYFISTRH